MMGRTQLFFLYFISLFMTGWLSGQSFPCDGTFYIVLQTNGVSYLKNIWVNDNGKLEIRDIPLNQPERRYTCLGMSIEDLFIYALDFETKELLRIDNSGTVTSLGVPENLNTNLEYWSGSVTPEGRRLSVIGRDPTTGRDKSIFNINLKSENHYAGSVEVISFFPSSILDFATDPNLGTVYGYDENKRQIVDIGGSAITHHNHNAAGAIIESLFFDRFGNLHGYGSSSSVKEQSVLYRINKYTGAATAIDSGPRGRYSDGCSCPATLTFTKTIRPKKLFPCSEFTIDYNIFNNSGVGKTGNTFRDVLPDYLTITELVDHTFTLATVSKAEGGSEFLIENLDVLIGENIIQIKGFVNPTAVAQFESQATLEGLPKGLGGDLLSDDPEIEGIFDPNVVEIYQSNSIRLEDFVTYNCERDTATILFPSTPNTYEWSTGEQRPFLKITAPGTYWAKAEWDCVAIDDTIVIESFPDALSLSFEEPMLEVMEGTALRLPYSTNLTNVTDITWESKDSFDLSCQDCSTPYGIALRNNVYFVELRNNNGCVLRDSITVTVIPNRSIYASDVFSPNDDGINDTFFLQGPEGTAVILKMMVFDRWGNMIFNQQNGILNDPENGWNGQVQGQFMNNGSYFWTAELEFLNGQKKIFSGDFLLLKQ